ncbi:hypothetical protein ACFQZ4_29140 [Catellatospora coxensis]
MLGGDPPHGRRLRGRRGARPPGRGAPSTVGTTVEINGGLPWRRRSWSPHPACDCTRRRRG